MKKTGIITDSHCGISIKEADKYGIKILPMPLYIDDECYYEDITITRSEFFEKLKTCTKVSTSQATPGDLLDLWREGLKEYETILFMPMSSGLSGACNSAKMFAMDEEFLGKVFVVDNGRISTPMHRTILDAVELIEKGYTASQIKDILENSKDDMCIYIAV
jgi:DegV family protein with EDD domain